LVGDSLNAIEVDGLSYTYDDGTPALDNISFNVKAGSHVAILGPNGAGKSTLLKIIAGLMFSYTGISGTVRLFGSEVTKKNYETVCRQVGLLFQDPDDQIFMPRVWDDVAFGPINLGLDELEVKRRVESSLKTLDLIGYDDRSPHHLSYGEKKRVAIAGILAMRPRVLLLDEFTANLDPKGRSEIIKVIKQLKTTVILVTHDINTAIELADSVIVLNKKKLAYGSVKEILTDSELLERSHLEMPEISKLFIELKKLGLECDDLPYDLSKAIHFLKPLCKLKT
jgi:cobalt/nickel transport system ATP-binding protein